MNIVLSVIGLFILGSVFGSFGSVLLVRLGLGVDTKTLKGIFFGFSHCPHCKHRLHAKNLIPIASFFLQKGVCEYCHKPISKFYPTIEILSGLIFVLTGLSIGSMGFGLGTGIFLLLTNWLLLLLIVYDLQKYELHVPLRIVAVALSLISQFVFRIGNYGQAFYFSLLMGSICLLIYRGAKWYVKKKYNKTTGGFGEGDIMMGFLLGTLMPFVILSNGITISFGMVVELIILFFLLSSLLGILGFGIKKLISSYSHFHLPQIKELQSTLGYVPFIPFMIFAFWVLLWGGSFFIKLLFM